MTLVSVVVATRNEGKNIERCIRSLLDQKCYNFEILVVDYGSTDNTKEIASRFTSNVYSLEEELDLSNIKNFRGAQLNLGVSKSKGNLIFFPDADMTFSDTLIQEAMNLLSNCDALYVPEIVVGDGIFSKARNFERSFYGTTCIDAVRFVTKNAFIEIGGYDITAISFGPDDWDFTKMLKYRGKRILITKAPLYHHEENSNLNMYLSKKGKYLSSFNGYVRKWGSKDPDIARQFSPFYRMIFVFTENGKIIKLLEHPILALMMFYIRFRVALLYLKKKAKID